MKVQLVDRSSKTIAYLRHLGPYGAPISSFWQKEVYPWMAENRLLGHPRYGISHDDPSITAPKKCRYDAGIEVASDFVTSGKVLKTTLPAGKYAVLRFKGTVEQIPAAWAALLRDWLPSSGMQLDARPAFEHYPKGSTYDSKTGVFDCEICVPVTPLRVGSVT